MSKEYVENFEEVITNAITKAVSEAAGEGVIVTKWVLVAEAVDATDTSLLTATSSNVTPWDIGGMLSLSIKQTESDYTETNSIIRAIAEAAEDDGDEDLY